MRLLVVEDEPKMLALLRRGLQEDGHVVDAVAGAEDAAFLANEGDYDAILLDVMLPDGDGIDLCREMRACGQWAPIIMLTARDSVEDRVRGLDCGADDYVMKPFAFDELLARLRALQRRGRPPRPTVLQVGPLALDPAAARVTVGGREVQLTARQFALLHYLVAHAGEVRTRTQIREHVWEDAFEGDSNVVDVYVGYLRTKIDRAFGLDLIETLRGVGYRIRKDADAVADTR